MSQHLREGWHRTAGRNFYHGSGAAIPVGGALVSGGPSNYQPDAYSQQGAIYVTGAMDMAFFYAVFGPFSAGDFGAQPRVYEVEAVNPVPAKFGEWTCDAATVLRDVTSEAKAQFRAGWESTWKPMILDTPSPGMPTTTMIVHEFESRMK